MSKIRDAFRFLLALILFVPFGIVVLIGYGGMLVMREMLEFLGGWEDG